MNISDATPEILNLDNMNDDKITIKENVTPKPSVNFGDGIELLMNEKRKPDGSQTPNSDVGLGDIHNLENELNKLSSETSGENRQSRSNIFNNAINNLNPLKDDIKNVPVSSTIKIDSLNNIGKATAGTSSMNEKGKTWDGYGKFNDIPIDPDKPVQAQPQLSKEELLREKFKYITSFRRI